MTIPAQLTVATPPSPETAASFGPFEGPEKLLEIWFAPSPDSLPSTSTSHSRQHTRREGERGGRGGDGFRGLRSIPRQVWEEMLDIVKCKVLSMVQGDGLDAYLLSESSLFVAPHLLILKTCGTTLNLLGLYRIIQIAREHCGFTNVWRCFYSRKSFFFPERQSGPHKDWRDEVNFLDNVFGSAGSAYIVGPMNRDHWLLYLTSPNSTPLLPTDISPPAQPTMTLPPPPSIPDLSTSTSPYQDVTFEILMTHLDPSAREPFFHAAELATKSLETGLPKAGHELGAAISSKMGIDNLFPKEETRLDSYGFEPCGYSANAVIGTGLPDTSPGAGGSGSGAGGGYYTIHVTPEDGWSYASFECNVPLPLDSSSSPHYSSSNLSTTRRPDLTGLIRNVVRIFQPNRLSITLFVSTPANHTASAQSGDTNPNSNAEGHTMSVIEARAWKAFGSDLLGKEFERKDRIGYEFDGYDLVFACFERKGWAEPGKYGSVSV